MRSQEGVEYGIIGTDVHLYDTAVTHPITGTYMGALLGVNKFKSRFQALCELFGVYTDSFEGNDATKAGQLLESRIIAMYATQTKNKVYAGDEAFPGCRHDGAHSTWDNHLSSDDGMLAGNIDALETDDTGHILDVIEVKTTQDIRAWMDKDGNITIPPQYHWQASLYAYLMDIKDIVFLVAALDKSDVDDPEHADLKDKVFVVRDRVPENMHEVVTNLQIDILNIKDKKIGIDIPSKPTTRDKDVLKALGTTYPDDADLKQLTEEYRTVSNQIAVIEETMKDITARRDQLKEAVKALANEEISNGASAVSCNGVKVYAQTKTTYNYEQMKKDGIDLSKYEKTTNYLTLKEE